jgi:hypothetical protein
MKKAGASDEVLRQIMNHEAAPARGRLAEMSPHGCKGSRLGPAGAEAAIFELLQCEGPGGPVGREAKPPGEA